MIWWREGVVDEVLGSWPGAVELAVRLAGDEADVAGDEADSAEEAPEAAGGDALVLALAYPRLVGEPGAGDRVVLSVAALRRGLGTGGYAMVVALPDRLPTDPPASPGHVVKARYTPLQAMVLGVDEEESVHHEVLREAQDVAGMPVVVADLHSALPAIIAGIRHEAHRQGRSQPRVAYVMSDGGALPLWFSRTAAALHEAGWIEGTLTAGQAFGGQWEAVNVHSALLAARHVAAADITVVAQGPGNLGTGTPWGFSGVSCGEAINAAHVLGGHPVASLRVSGADPRPRHHGVSHHSLTAYGTVARCPADVVVPETGGEPDPLAALWGTVASQATSFTSPSGIHRQVRVSLEGLDEALATSPVRLSAMGRGLRADPGAFLASAASGVHACRLLD